MSKHRKRQTCDSLTLKKVLYELYKHNKEEGDEGSTFDWDDRIAGRGLPWVEKGEGKRCKSLDEIVDVIKYLMGIETNVGRTFRFWWGATNKRNYRKMCWLKWTVNGKITIKFSRWITGPTQDDENDKNNTENVVKWDKWAIKLCKKEKIIDNLREMFPHNIKECDKGYTFDWDKESNGTMTPDLETCQETRCETLDEIIEIIENRIDDDNDVDDEIKIFQFWYGGTDKYWDRKFCKIEWWSWNTIARITFSSKQWYA